jgi:hypothetical protein
MGLNHRPSNSSGEGDPRRPAITIEGGSEVASWCGCVWGGQGHARARRLELEQRPGEGQGHYRGPCRDRDAKGKAVLRARLSATVGVAHQGQERDEEEEELDDIMWSVGLDLIPQYPLCALHAAAAQQPHNKRGQPGRHPTTG